MNPDESQYAAHASFLVRSHQSAFDSPILHVYTHWIYGIFASLFGEYEFFPIRVFFLALCFFSAWLVHETCRLALRAWLSAGAALFFLYFVVYFEGLSANREWLCLPLLLASNFIYLRHANGGKAWFLLAGFLAALSVWIKEQAVLLCLPIAADLAIEWWKSNDRRASAMRLATYSLGLALGLVVPTLPMLIHGTLHEQLDWLVRTEFRYALAGYQGETFATSFRDYWDALYQNIPFRRMFIVAYGVAAAALMAAVVRPPDGSAPDRAHRVLRLTALQLVFALLAVQLGRRFFLHYYLFLAPSVCILLAFCLAWLLQKAPQSPWGPSICGLVIAWLLFDLLFMPSLFDWQTVGWSTSARAWQIGLLIFGVWFAFAELARRRGWSDVARLLLPGVCAILLVSDILYGSARIHASNNRVVGPSVTQFAAPRLMDWLGDHAEPRDQIFVWGWRPEIYLQSRLGASTRFAYCADIADNLDHALVLEPKYDNQYVDWLIADLEMSEPRFFVDAGLYSFYGAGFRLDYVPPIRDFVDRHYCYRTTLDGCDVYERCAANETPPASPDPADTDRKLQILDPFIDEQPTFALMLLLNRGDVLAQAGQTEAACDTYREILRIAPYWPQPRQRLLQLQCEP
jgi:hypothetical protein